MTDDRTLSLLGLARRGGNLALGEEPVAEACALGKAKLVLIACDAGSTTARRGARMAEGAGTPAVTLPWGKAELGRQLGRASCALLAVTDRGLACAVVKRLAGDDPVLRSLAERLTGRAQRRRGPGEEKTCSTRAEDAPAQR